MSCNKTDILVWKLTSNISFYHILLKCVPKKNINFRDNFIEMQSYKLEEFQSVFLYYDYVTLSNSSYIIFS